MHSSLVPIRGTLHPDFFRAEKYKVYSTSIFHTHKDHITNTKNSNLTTLKELQAMYVRVLLSYFTHDFFQ